MGRWEKVLPLLQHSPDPTARSYLIGELGAMVDARKLRARLGEGPEVSIRRALLLALGDFDQDGLPAVEREQWSPWLEEVYRNDPDAGIHGAAGWLLRQWGRHKKLAEIDRDFMRRDGEVACQGRLPADGRQWYVNGQRQTLVVLPPGKLRMREGAQQKRQIEDRFGLAAREVTVADFLRFRKGHTYVQRSAPTLDCPVNSVSWYDAAAYCNWLSEKEGIPKEEWCYLPNDKGQYAAGMKVPADSLRRTGYRLPTEAEWEYACRAASTTAWSMGDAEYLLAKCAWYVFNAEGESHPVGMKWPNDWGLFDLLGNVREWCHDGYSREGDKKDKEDIEYIKDQDNRPLRGGTFLFHTGYVRSASRVGGTAVLRDPVSGFRPARTFR
jgi:formylglycine-generating enzyme required for sulfatase activity